MAIITAQVTRRWSPIWTRPGEAVALMLASFAKDDFREGVLSHLEKRPPRFPPLDPL